MRKVYMQVTMDKYELPLAIADTAQELAEICNTTANSIYCSCSKRARGIYKKARYISVEIDEE